MHKHLEGVTPHLNRTNGVTGGWFIFALSLQTSSVRQKEHLHSLVAIKILNLLLMCENNVVPAIGELYK